MHLTASRIAVLLVTVALAPVAAGCGSSGSKGTDGSSSGANRAALRKFSACLKQHGVSFSRPGRTGGGAPPGAGGKPQKRPRGRRPTMGKKQQAAFTACRKYMPARSARGAAPGYGGPGGPPPGGQGGPPPGGAPPPSGTKSQ